jgi:ubiquinone/menaquinone biosynthesis methyltransferase
MAWFGFERVEDFIKTERIHDLFHRVTGSYDLMNDAMSLGVHRYWKDYFVKNLTLPMQGCVLDMATGTGDIVRKIKGTYPFLDLRITAADLTESMLEAGKDHSINAGVLDINYVVADAEKMPFEDASFDAYTISFGMRNVGNIEAALQEAYRVLKPGGRFYCLEFSHVENQHIKMAYDIYSKIIPTLGGYIAKDKAAYQYLVDSIRSFPTQNEYMQKIEAAGFKDVHFTNLTFGVVAVHQGMKKI